jgi:short-subunit dehydrogenase
VEIGGARVLLTGATGGLGAVMARALAARGAAIVLTGRRIEALQALAGSLPGGAAVLVADLSSPEQAVRLAADAGAIDVLVANAGVEAVEELQDVDAAEVQRVLAINLVGPTVLARELAPGMLARGRGHVVFLSSLAGKMAQPATARCTRLRSGGFAALRFHSVRIGVAPASASQRLTRARSRRPACTPAPAL